jgi:hypothetical protein
VKAAIDLKANIADPTFTTKATAPYFVSSVAVGTQPFQCTSTTKNTNLNADQVDGADLETASISNDNTHVPASALVYAVKTTADAALPKAGGVMVNNAAIKWRNAANNADLECLKLDGFDNLMHGSANVKDHYFDHANGYVVNIRNSSYTSKPLRLYNYNGVCYIDTQGAAPLIIQSADTITVNSISTHTFQSQDSDTQRTILILADSVEDADSYVQITNGKAGTSDTIIESAGTANTLRISCGASQSILFYHGSTYQGGFTPTGFSVLNKYMYCRNSSDTASAAGTLYLARRRTTSPFVVQNGDMIGQIVFEAYDGADRSVAFIRSYVTAASSSGDVPTDLRFYTTPDGSATPLEVLRLKTSIASADNYFSLTNSTASGEAILTTSSASSTLRIGNPTVGTTNLICSSSHVGLRRYNDTAASGSTLTFIRLRDGTPTFDLSNGDLIGTLNSLGYVGTYLSGPSIDYSVSGTPSTGLGSKITLKTVGTAANTRYNVLELAASVASAVNYATITNSATNTPPILAAEGTDTDINLLLQTKGAGHVYVKDEAGNWESIEADDFVNNSPKVYNAGLAELIAMTDVNDHKQLPAEVKRVYQDPIMRTEIQSKLIMDEETKKESVRDVEVQVVDHYEERVAESLGSAVQWLKRSLQQEHQEKVILEQRVQTLEQQLNELLELMKM